MRRYAKQAGRQIHVATIKTTRNNILKMINKTTMGTDLFFSREYEKKQKTKRASVVIEIK